MTDNTTVSDVICETSTTNVTIQVVQDLAPEFTEEQYAARINETASVGTPVTMVINHLLNSILYFVQLELQSKFLFV